jgi:hypothetical protein
LTLFAAVHGVDTQEELEWIMDGQFRGCSYKGFICRKCKHHLGKKFQSTNKTHPTFVYVRKIITKTPDMISNLFDRNKFLVHLDAVSTYSLQQTELETITKYVHPSENIIRTANSLSTQLFKVTLWLGLKRACSSLTFEHQIHRVMLNFNQRLEELETRNGITWIDE